MTHTDEWIDRAIDDVARAMTSQPSPALRAHVVARLRPRRAQWPSWLAPAAAVLATASTALLLVTWSRVVVRIPTAVTSPPALLQPVATFVPRPQSPGPEARRPSIRRVDGTTGADSEAAAWRARAVPALEAVPGLTMTAIQPTAMLIPQLSVAPIAEAAPLAVAAIDGVNRHR
jgi:hypothetical protein